VSYTSIMTGEREVPVSWDFDDRREGIFPENLLALGKCNLGGKRGRPQPESVKREEGCFKIHQSKRGDNQKKQTN